MSLIQSLDPISKNTWAIEVDGIQQFQAQKATLPKLDAIPKEYSNGRFRVKRPSGLYTVGDLVLHTLRPSNFADTWVFDWFSQVNPMNIARNLLRRLFLKDGRLVMYDASLANIAEIYEFENLWVKGIDPGELDLNAGDPVIHQITFSVDNMVRTR